MSKKQKYENYVNSLSEKEAKKELLELLIKYDTLGAKLNKLTLTAFSYFLDLYNLSKLVIPWFKVI